MNTYRRSMEEKVELKKRILLKLDEMSRYLSELDDFLPDGEKEYAQEPQVRRACEKTVELAIESVLSVVSMIVSHQRLGLPESEDDLINILEKKNILSPALAEKVRGMKGFRNILVHRYGEVNDHLAYKNMSEKEDDFLRFEKEVRTHIKKLK